MTREREAQTRGVRVPFNVKGPTWPFPANGCARHETFGRRVYLRAFMCLSWKRDTHDESRVRPVDRDGVATGVATRDGTPFHVLHPRIIIAHFGSVYNKVIESIARLYLFSDGSESIVKILDAHSFRWNRCIIIEKHWIVIGDCIYKHSIKNQ